MKASDRRWSRLSLTGKSALIGFGMFVSVGLFSMGAALPRMAESFADVPNATLMIQLIGAIVAPVFALASPLAGWLISRFGIRAVYIASIVLMAIGGAGPALCNSLSAILALRVLLALGVAGGFTAGMSGIARLPDDQRPVVLGLNSFVGGAICLPLLPLVGILAEQSWRYAFATHLILLPLIFLALALPGRDSGATPAETASGRAARSGASLLGGVPLMLAVVTAFSGLTMVASSMYTPFLLATIGITQPARIGQILAVMAFCSLAGSGSYGFVHRRIGTAGLLKLGLASMGAGCLLIGLAQVLPLAMAGMGLVGLGLAVFAASAYAAAIDSVGPGGNAPAAMGVMTFCLYGSQIAFPLISGILAPLAGPAGVFLLLAALMAFGLLLSLTIGRPALVHAPT